MGDPPALYYKGPVQVQGQMWSTWTLWKSLLNWTVLLRGCQNNSSITCRPKPGVFNHYLQTHRNPFHKLMKRIPVGLCANRRTGFIRTSTLHRTGLITHSSAIYQTQNYISVSLSNQQGNVNTALHPRACTVTSSQHRDWRCRCGVISVYPGHVRYNEGIYLPPYSISVTLSCVFNRFWTIVGKGR